VKTVKQQNKTNTAKQKIATKTKTTYRYKKTHRNNIQLNINKKQLHIQKLK